MPIGVSLGEPVPYGAAQDGTPQGYVSSQSCWYGKGKEKLIKWEEQ
ncbi:hypothetical protein H5T87_10400 [bacterium]|nr:hypothetical protein [bacterium]